MIDKFLQIYRRAVDIIFMRSKTWGTINNETTSEQDLFNRYTVPHICVCVCVIFVFNFIYKNGFQGAFLNAVLTAVSLLGAYLIAKWALHFFLTKKYDPYADKTDTAKLVTYGFSVVYLVEIADAIIPSVFLFRLFLLYTYILASDGCKILLDLPQSKQNNTVLFLFLLILFLPTLLTFMMKLFLPNAQI